MHKSKAYSDVDCTALHCIASRLLLTFGRVAASGVGGLNAVLFGSYGLAARMITGKPQAKDELTLGQAYFAGV